MQLNRVGYSDGRNDKKKIVDTSSPILVTPLQRKSLGLVLKRKAFASTVPSSRFSLSKIFLHHTVAGKVRVVS